MLHILLMILKIVGIIILIVLGLILLLLLLILFAPVRYRIQAHKYDDVFAKVSASWLLFVLRFKLEYNGERTDTKIKIFGIDASRFINNNDSDKKSKKSEDSKEDDVLGLDEDMDDTVKEDSISDVTGSIKINDSKQKDISDINDSMKNNDIIKNSDSRQNELSAVNDSIKSDNEAIHVNTNQADNTKTADNKKQRTRKKPGVFSKLITKAKRIYQRIRHILAKLKKTIKKLKDIKNTASAMYDFINSREFRDNFAFLKQQLKKLFRHIMPSKHDIKINFGTGSPDTTGEILGVIAVLMAFTGLNIQVTPDFDNAVFNGEVYIKGRIRLFNILVVALKMYFNKELKAVADKIINRRF